MIRPKKRGIDQVSYSRVVIVHLRRITKRRMIQIAQPVNRTVRVRFQTDIVRTRRTTLKMTRWRSIINFRTRSRVGPKRRIKTILILLSTRSSLTCSRLARCSSTRISRAWSRRWSRLGPNYARNYLFWTWMRPCCTPSSKSTRPGKFSHQI